MLASTTVIFGINPNYNWRFVWPVSNLRSIWLGLLIRHALFGHRSCLRQAAIVCLPHSLEHVGRCPSSKCSVVGEFILGSQNQLSPLFPTIGHSPIVSAHPCNFHMIQMGNCLVFHITHWETFSSIALIDYGYQYCVSDILNVQVNRFKFILLT